VTNPPFGLPLGGSGDEPGPIDPAQVAAFMSQMQMLFSASGSGPVNWELAKQVAEGAIRPGDRSLTSGERDAAVEAIRLADLWLDPITALPSGVTAPTAWSRMDWLAGTSEGWHALCEPVAERVVGAMGGLIPEESRGQLGPMAGMLSPLGGMMFGGQVGQGLGHLATEVLTSSDIGIPLGRPGVAALLPANLAEFSSGLGLPLEEVRLYVALREAAHHRLFGHAAWLRSHVLSAVQAWAAGIEVDPDAIGEAVQLVDPTDPESIQGALAGGVFSSEDNPAQRIALTRLETVLALVEGWVAQVVDAAATGRLPGSVRLSEAFRRRRAAGGPGEQTFATLVGLELRPRRLREASELWAALAEAGGVDGRDALWAHPDLLPGSDDLDDPTGFVANSSVDLVLDMDALQKEFDELTKQMPSEGPDAGPHSGPDSGPVSGPDSGPDRHDETDDGPITEPGTGPDTAR
jgi:putative hydrolase